MDIKVEKAVINDEERFCFKSLWVFHSFNYRHLFSIIWTKVLQETFLFVYLFIFFSVAVPMAPESHSHIHRPTANLKRPILMLQDLVTGPSQMTLPQKSQDASAPYQLPSIMCMMVMAKQKALYFTCRGLCFLLHKQSLSIISGAVHALFCFMTVS